MDAPDLPPTDIDRLPSHRGRGEILQLRGDIVRRFIPAGGVGVELGVHKGSFASVLLDRVLPKRLHLVDPWYLCGDRWDWAEGNPSTIDALVRVLETFREELISQKVVLHVGYDQDVLPTFPDRCLDWAYVDSSHEYEHTKIELDLLRTKVKAGGVIAGDDWITDPRHIHHGVCRAVTELVEREPYEIVYANEDDMQWAVREKGR
jgi:hypothetical protein